MIPQALDPLPRKQVRAVLDLGMQTRPGLGKTEAQIKTAGVVFQGEVDQIEPARQLAGALGILQSHQHVKDGSPIRRTWDLQLVH